MANKQVLPHHENTLVIIHLEGYQIATVLEQALQKLFDDAALYKSMNRTFTGTSYPYGAGIRFDVNMTKPFPYRVSHIEVLNREGQTAWGLLVLQGVHYTVVTNSYLAAGGDGYHEFISEMEPTDAHYDTRKIL